MWSFLTVFFVLGCFAVLLLPLVGRGGRGLICSTLKENPSQNASRNGTSTPAPKLCMAKVHNPYCLPEIQPKVRVFCSSKAIPHTPDEELKEYFGFLSQHIAHLHRPNPNKEFVYLEFDDEGAASWLLSQHPLVLKNSRLNVSPAHEKQLPK